MSQIDVLLIYSFSMKTKSFSFLKFLLVCVIWKQHLMTLLFLSETNLDPNNVSWIKLLVSGKVPYSRVSS